MMLLYGCNENENRISDSYNGNKLEIGVVGSELPMVKNVEYTYVKLNEIYNNNSLNFDALIITPEEFSEADKVKYVSFYDKVEYPVLFFGEKDFRIFAFTNENMSIEESKDDNDSYIEGFRNVDGAKEGIGFIKSSDTDTDTEMLIRLFNYLDNLDYIYGEK